jgi:hypothetical protein
MVGWPFAQAEAGRCVLYRARNSVAAGIGLNFTPLEPIKGLYRRAVINGVLAPPVMVLMMLLVRRKKVMGELQVKGVAELARVANAVMQAGRSFGWAAPRSARLAGFPHRPMGTASAPGERARRGGLGLHRGCPGRPHAYGFLFRNVRERTFGLPLHRSKFVARATYTLSRV